MNSNLKKNSDVLCDDEVFDDSSVFANFENVSFRDPTANTSNISNLSALSFDEEISGYDKESGKTWIYPTNYPIRDYQFNIIRAAITKNTLVSLPTGLGKTFIAAVIMFNFYRWYPMGKIVFMAPTRPLVAQQIEACYNIIGLPPNDTIEMTGHMQINTRKTHWLTKRVVFATPQVIYNDIKSGICEGKAIRCLVIDEAHKAKGNYAYCQIISILTEMGHKIYRILALSATPGSRVEDVISVIRNLHISHLELRNENCIDVVAYSHSRKISTVVIPLGSQLTQLRHQYVEILDGYARRLKQFNILPQNLGNLSKGRIVMLYKEFQAKERGARHPQHNYIMKDFTLLIALYHGLELLVKHGSRVFLNFFDEHPEKSWIQADDNLTSLLERLRDDLGIDPLSLDRSVLPDGTIPEMPKNLSFGHPKFYKLKEIMLDHFNKAKKNGQETKAIVFCEYRESVNLVHCLLLQCRPLIVPQMFVGQGASGKDKKTLVSQKQQLRVMRGFRAGACNTLVCTCVAEEGLDVGSVDLILCFDISTRSPIRLVQRCGRTGRERGGQVFILVTEGREHQTLIDCMHQRDGLNDRILHSKEVKNNLYKLNPRMIPLHFMPECQKTFIKVEKPSNKPKEDDPSKKKNQKDLRSMLVSKSSSSSKEKNNDEWITKQEFDETYPKGFIESRLFDLPVAYWAMNKESVKIKGKEYDPILNLSTWIECQRNLQKTVTIGHSRDSKILTDLLQYTDNIRFDMPPPSQFPKFSTQDLALQNLILSPAKTKTVKKKITKKLPLIKSPCKKDGDIRTLFSTATKSTKNYTKLIHDLGISNDGKTPTNIVNLLVDLCLDNANITKACYICLNVCHCKILDNEFKNKNVPSIFIPKNEPPNLPCIDLIDNMTKETFANLMFDNPMEEWEKPISNVDYIDDTENHNMDNKSKNFDLELDFESLSEENSVEENKGKRHSPILGEIQHKREFEELSKPHVARVPILSSENTKVSQIVKNTDKDNLMDLGVIQSDKESIVIEKVQDKKRNMKNVETNFDIGDIDDIFADSSSDDENVQNQNDSKNNEVLNYFQLNSIEDIFAYSDEEVPEINREEKLNPLKGNVDSSSIDIKIENKILNDPIRPPSPSILSGKTINNNMRSTSPILCTQTRISNNVPTKMYPLQSSTPQSVERKLSLYKTKENEFQIPVSRKADNQSVSSNSDIKNKSDKSLLTITQLVDMINKTPNQSTSLIKPIQNETQDVVENKRRTSSPIILTQRDKEISTNKTHKDKLKVTQRNESIIIPDSDSEESTELYDVDVSRKNTLNRGTLHDDDDLSILLTQCDKPTNTTVSNPNAIAQPCLDQNIINLDSDSDFEENDSNKIKQKDNVTSKRKYDDNDTDNLSSPYFAKKIKLNDNGNKQLSLQKKIIAALTSNKFSDNTFNNKNTQANFMFHSPLPSITQKENFSPLVSSPKEEKPNKLEMLQMYRRDAKNSDSNKIFKDSTNICLRRKITFSDSDDDFVNDGPKRKEKPVKQMKGVRENGCTNHKIRKKIKKANEFLDLEAELSDDANFESGDELTDESVGSIIDFICDENDDQEDIHAVYLKSVKSPVQGVFKIPQLNDNYKRSDILSQSYVENDTYELDSFCVEPGIGLTQVNEISELELAEMKLEQRRRNKKSKNLLLTNDSPVVRKKFRKIARRISSDSDSS